MQNLFFLVKIVLGRGLNICIKIKYTFIEVLLSMYQIIE